MVINPIVGVYIPIIRIPIKGVMTIPNIATFDHGTCQHGQVLRETRKVKQGCDLFLPLSCCRQSSVKHGPPKNGPKQFICSQMLVIYSQNTSVVANVEMVPKMLQQMLSEKPIW